MTTTTLHPEEVEAAELEGFLAIDNDPAAMALVWSFKAQRRLAKAASDAKGVIANRLMEYIESHGARAITIGGQKFAQKQVVSETVVFNEADFAKDHPDLHRQYMTKRKAGSVKLWVRPQDGDEA